VVVIQADALTEAGLATLLVRVPIRARDRLLLECWGMAEQPRALDRNRIGEGP
jgi:mRNA interferase MazF